MYPKGSTLRIDMTDWNGKNIYAKYDSFQVGNEKTKYKIHVSGYTGNAGDSLKSHNGYRFSTYDQDNDGNPDGSCAVSHRGAWWYTRCYNSNLNGEYLLYKAPQPGYARGVIWEGYKGNTHSFKFVEMKVRRNL